MLHSQPMRAPNPAPRGVASYRRARVQILCSAIRSTARVRRVLARSAVPAVASPATAASIARADTLGELADLTDLVARVIGDFHGAVQIMAAADGSPSGLVTAAAGEQRAAISAAIELGRRVATSQIGAGNPSFRGPDDVVAFARARWGALPQETFAAIGLDARQRVTRVYEIAIGSLSNVEVHPREVFRRAISDSVHSLVIVHNHPSGSPDPSAADDEITDRLCRTGALVGIPVLDHVIVSRLGHVSYAACGTMPRVGAP